MSDKKKKPTGKKFDKGKLRWDLLPTKPLESVIRVLMLGSKKYGDDNWKVVPGYKKRYYAACLRHLTVWWEGEKIDPESGESHLGHAMCCLIFLLWHEMMGTDEAVITEEEVVVHAAPPVIPEKEPTTTETILLPTEDLTQIVGGMVKRLLGKKE
jgi:hypothetical protein